MEFGPYDKSLTSTSNFFGSSIHAGIKIFDIEIEKYFLKRLKHKRQHRTNSKYNHRIYLFESEHYPGFDYGIIGPNGMTNQTKKNVQKYLDSKNTKDIVIIIERNTANDRSPRISRTIFSNNVDDSILDVIKNIKFDLFKINP